MERKTRQVIYFGGRNMGRTRLLRYICNRPKPEEKMWETIDDYVRNMSTPILLLGESELELLKRLGEDKVPDPMFSDFRLNDGLWTPFREDEITYSQLMNMPPAIPAATFTYEHTKKKEIPQDEFEVNLVEPLIGWRAWWVDEHYMLRSLNDTEFVWPAATRAEASCNVHGQKHVPPVEKCSCGIYAVQTKSYLREQGYCGQDGLVVGLVYGWGRYVRGEHGFRCQYAYPRALYLNDATAQLVNKLTHYRVPIYFEQPIRIYSPSEDGYENGYWENETDGSLGAGAGSGAAEEGSASEDCPF